MSLTKKKSGVLQIIENAIGEKNIWSTPDINECIGQKNIWSTPDIIF